MPNPQQDRSVEDRDEAVPVGAPAWAEIARALPFGLSITRADGAAICANASYFELSRA